jgi:hypothetical protein
MSQMMLKMLADMAGIKAEDLTNTLTGIVELAQNLDARLSKIERLQEETFNLVQSMTTGIYILPDASASILSQEFAKLESEGWTSEQN